MAGHVGISSGAEVRATPDFAASHGDLRSHADSHVVRRSFQNRHSDVLHFEPGYKEDAVA